MADPIPLTRVSSIMAEFCSSPKIYGYYNHIYNHIYNILQFQKLRSIYSEISIKNYFLQFMQGPCWENLVNFRCNFFSNTLLNNKVIWFIVKERLWQSIEKFGIQQKIKKSNGACQVPSFLPTSDSRRIGGDGSGSLPISVILVNLSRHSTLIISEFYWKSHRTYTMYWIAEIKSFSVKICSLKGQNIAF